MSLYFWPMCGFILSTIVMLVVAAYQSVILAEKEQHLKYLASSNGKLFEDLLDCQHRLSTYRRKSAAMDRIILEVEGLDECET